ncbi:MAG: ATP-binding cassette domain-containing protein, partial [Oscillospiraceae bacterium]|nr:ATP-binding cassette domain-containing protein [Oscillospiraceae bacterium]
MLQVKDLTVTHKKDLTTLVEGLSFVLSPGDRAALIGEEGNGKSTVLKLLYDPVLVAPYVEWTGEIVDKGLRKGYLAQELTPDELALPVWEFCQSSPAFTDADPKALDRAARQVGLGADLFWDGRPMSTLSGGERVKLRLALLLLDSPDVLLLDEPSNDLDLATLEWLEGFLLECRVPVLYISHDETLLANTANVIIHLERLRRRTVSRCTVSRMGYEQYVEQRQAGFAHQEQMARKERADFDAKMEKYRKIRDKVDHQQDTISRQDPHGGRLLKKKMHAVQP